ncbi:phosphate ABC transporter permease subunit PstC [Clostridium hydrogeniformans]|uniref:phosphate ABC transporter permease subunit PstC n=1 Tax=Clostridium hydrogeniformans TaxID=349933 RepID=UPI0004868B26|nr:phosphate ABC transporter permease subunit PstC [Clostridium hydrogeniformans]
MKSNRFTKLRNEYLGRTYATICGVLIVVLTLSIMLFVFSKGMTTFKTTPISEFLFSPKWVTEGDTSFGSLIFLAGSILVSFGAIVIAAPIAVALAIFMNLISKSIGSKILQPALELFVGIPSVVYGWIGISFLVPLIKRGFGGIGFSVLAAILVLSVMILPTIASIASDAIKTVPREYIEASYGLGATRWQTISKVVVPAAKKGILTGIVLGVARAFGEALAVQMVIGNSIKFPKGILDSTTTLTGILTMDMANTINGTPWNDALWSLASLLLVVSFIFILVIRAIGKRGESK